VRKLYTYIHCSECGKEITKYRFDPAELDIEYSPIPVEWYCPKCKKWVPSIVAEEFKSD